MELLARRVIDMLKFTNLVRSEHRVIEPDEAFFESFAALCWQHENKKLRMSSIDHQDEACEVSNDLDTSVKKTKAHTYLGLKSHLSSKLDEENLYMELCYTIVNRIGITMAAHIHSQETLLKYLQKAFGYTLIRHNELLVRAQLKPGPSTTLRLGVKAARNLESKDANGFSDPYVMLGIMPAFAMEEDYASIGASQTGDQTAGKKTKGASLAIGDEESHEEEKPWKRLSFRRKKNNNTANSMVPPTTVCPSPAVSNGLAKGGSSNNATNNSIDSSQESNTDESSGLYLQPPPSPKPCRSGMATLQAPQTPKAAPASPKQKRRWGSFRQKKKGEGENECPIKSASGAISTPSSPEHSRTPIESPSLLIHDSPPSPVEGTGPVRNKNSSSFKKKQAKELPAKIIKCTSVIPRTLNPVWNESFQFSLDDVSTDALHLDIWDHDSDVSVIEAAKLLNEVSSMKGMERYFKQIVQSARTNRKEQSMDDYLGSLNVRLDDLPSAGRTRWYHIHNRANSRPMQGEIQLELHLSTSNRATFLPVALSKSQVIFHYSLQIFLDYQFKRDVLHVFSFSGNIDREADSILHQLTIQYSMDAFQYTLGEWYVYSCWQICQFTDFSHVLRILENLTDQWTAKLLNHNETAQFVQSIKAFVHNCHHVLERLYDTIPVYNEQTTVYLGNILRCLYTLHSSDMFKHYVPSHVNLHHNIETLCKKSCIWLYEHQQTTLQENSKNLLGQVQALSKLVSVLVSDLKSSTTYLQSVYKEVVNIDFTSVCFKQYDQMLIKDLCSITQQVDIASVAEWGTSYTQLMVAMFELYLHCKDMMQFKAHLSPNDQKNLMIRDYYLWFRKTISSWINLVQNRLLHKISGALHTDKVYLNKVDNPTQLHLPSAVELCTCINQTAEFWKFLQYPDHVANLTFIVQIIEAICNVCCYFGTSCHDNFIKLADVQSKGFHNQMGLCCNTVEEVRSLANKLPSLFDWDSVFASLPANQSDTRTVTQNSATLQTCLAECDSDMKSKITDGLSKMLGDPRDAMKKNIFHLIWSPDTLSPKESLKPLCKYLSSVMDFHRRLLVPNNFDLQLLCLWRLLFAEIQDAIFNIEDAQQKSPGFFRRLHACIKYLRDYFISTSAFLSKKDFDNEAYQELREYLLLHKATSHELIELYYMEKMREQADWTRLDYGTFSLKAYYNHSAYKLCIELINAHDTIPCDPNGLSDPFVILTIQPEHICGKVDAKKTKVIHNTLDPEFRESFEFTVSQAACSHEASCLVLTLMDYDYVFSNDFAGELHLPLASVYGVSEDEKPTSFKDAQLLTFFITQPSPDDNAPYQTLCQRARWDNLAAEFVRQRQPILEQTKEES